MLSNVNEIWTFATSCQIRQHLVYYMIHTYNTIDNRDSQRFILVSMWQKYDFFWKLLKKWHVEN